MAVQDDENLWLALWVRRSPRGEFFIFQPRGDGGWNPRTSYHLDGTLHLKSHDVNALPPQKRQPLSGRFVGCVHLGAYGGHGPKPVRAICDPADFTGVFEVSRGLLGPVHGTVTIDLLEPSAQPVPFPGNEVARHLFDDVIPNLLIRIFS